MLYFNYSNAFEDVYMAIQSLLVFSLFETPVSVYMKTYLYFAGALGRTF